MYSEDGLNRKKNNYKLLIDPELQKGKKKLYRLNGALPGKAPIPDPKDPRVVKTVLGGTGNEIELYVPRFKYDRFWINDPPLREVFISGITEALTKGTLLQDTIQERVGPIHTLRYHKNLKTVGCASVSFMKAGDGVTAVDKLHGLMIGGTKLHVLLDDKGEHVSSSFDDRRTSIDSIDAITPTFKSEETTPFFNSSTNNKDEHTNTALSSQKFISALSLYTPSNSTPSINESPSGCGQETPDSGISLRHSFDPLLALRVSLATKRATPTITKAPPPPPPEEKAPPPPPKTTPPQITKAPPEQITKDDNIDSDNSKVHVDAVEPLGASPLPVFEEISGDESPVMVYSHLEVEEISSDEGRGSDMDISDTENDDVIELNVASVTPLPAPPSLPSTFSKVYSTSHTIETPPIDHTLSNGYPHSDHTRSKYVPARQWKVPPAITREERCGQNVLYCALEQLSRILLRDVEKKLVETSSFPVLDQYWDKRQKGGGEEGEEGKGEEEIEKPKPQEPYRRMLPGLTLPGMPRPLTGDATTPITPRKRLMNFKIPLTNRSNGERRGDTVMATQRRLYKKKDDSSEEEEEFRDGRYRRRREKRKRREDVSKTRRDKRRRGKSPDQLSQLSDISSDELSSDNNYERKRKTRKRKTPKLEEQEKEEIEKEKSIDEIMTGPRTPSPHSEEEEEEKEEDKESDDDSVSFNNIFGSSSQSSPSSSSDDFEAEIASLRQPKKQKLTQKTKTSTKNKSTKLSDVQPVVTAPVVTTPPVLSDVEEEETKEKVVEFEKRKLKEEESILCLFKEEGIDKEDLAMIKLAYTQLLEHNDELVTDIPWAYYPPVTSTPPLSKTPRYHDDELHPSGCARSEGYYKINPSDKSKYLPHLRRSKEGGTTSTNKALPASSGRGNRLNHRRVASLYTSGDVSRELQQYNQLKARKKQLKFAKSTIHNWGLFALETVPADEMVVEYIGQVIRHGVADERERRYESQGIGSSYLFRVDYDYVIDATKIGNFARFINHCCDPNCYAKIISVATHKKIVIYSKRDIQAGEEITYDYKFPIEDEKIPCLCGAPQCRGTLN